MANNIGDSHKILPGTSPSFLSYSHGEMADRLAINDLYEHHAVIHHQTKLIEAKVSSPNR